ncbi:hypothetical protein H4R19_000941 [Coemansia spiralis]|nr:hypothetical protein H4R19_000941 [Coemansia spiralis]
MPSIFGRKSKSSSRAPARPPSGVPESFGHSRGGMTHLRRNDSPDMAMPRPPSSQQQTSPVPPLNGRNAASGSGMDRYAPMMGPGQLPRNGAPLHSASFPDARQVMLPPHGPPAPASTQHQPQYSQYQPQQPQPQPQVQQQPPPPQPQLPHVPNGMGQPPHSEQRPVSRGASGSFWSKRGLKGQPPFPWRGFSTTLHDQVLYWFGGKSDGRLTNDLYTMDTATWEVHCTQAGGSIPEPREGHTATFIGRTMFVFGGELESRACDDNLYAYNMANSTWYRVPMQGEALLGRKGHTAVAVGSKMHVFGGTAEGHFLNDLVSFDVRAASKHGPRWNFDGAGSRSSQVSMRRDEIAPPPRAGHSCSVYPGSIYVFGGMNGERCFNDLWTYDMELRRWSLITPHGATPPARYGHASAVVDDCIFIMGGRTLHGEPLNDFFAYKISSQRWYTFQVNSAAWPHQTDPVFSLVKTRLLLYSGTMPRDDAAAEPAVYSLDTSKIKIQPDAPRPGTAPPAALPPAPAGDDSADAARRRHSQMPPPQQQQQLPQQPGRAASASNASEHGSGLQLPLRPSPPGALDTAGQAPGSLSVDSFEVVSPFGPEDESAQRLSAGSSAWSAQGAAKSRAHPRRSIALSQSMIASPPTGPVPPPAHQSDGDIAGSTESSPEGLAGEKADDRRLTIQLRNRSSAANLADNSRAVPEPVQRAEPPVHPNGSSGSVGGVPGTPEARETATLAWGALEAKYGSSSRDGSSSDVNEQVLGVLLAMRRELVETKQQLSSVSQVALERVAEAGRGRKAALQEAIYLKAKASALAAGSPHLLGRLNGHRTHELERQYANALNDGDALRSQLAAANLALKQSQDTLGEVRADAELTRQQLQELQANAPGSPGADRQLADLRAQLAERDAALEARTQADIARTERLEAALQAAAAAEERTARVQTMLEESLACADQLSEQTAELTALVDRERSEAQRAGARAAKYEQLWTDAKDEMAAFGSLRRTVEQLEAKDRHIATLERKLSDAPRPTSAGAGDEDNKQQQQQQHVAYLAAHRQWAEARDELLALKGALRESEEQRRDGEARLHGRDRELGDLQARLAAFTGLLQEYADRKHNAATLRPDDVSVAGMLSAIQQLQHPLTADAPPPAKHATDLRAKPSPALDLLWPSEPAHIL